MRTLDLEINPMLIAGILIAILLLESYIAFGYQQQVANQTTQIATLGDKVNSLNATIISLRDQVTSLQGQIATLTAVNLVATFGWRNNCVVTCDYDVNGSFANVGTSMAYAINLTFTFYSGPTFTGTTLCAITHNIGDMPGRTIDVLPALTCAGSTNTPAVSMNYQFFWS